ncbi:AAA family ATPase [Veillonella sp. CHU740]|uniref:ATP-binding protein n=1 Tax=Veillonella sp. CHU740 TaxID=2490950 RepID=UPI0013DFB12B|nr:AAA family ATPase [Veillonella sp. CHU740]
MKIKEIYIEQYGPYEKWSFQAHEAGLHVLYGPNGSGKTTLLQAFRGILLGTKRKEEPVEGHIVVERQGKTYHIGRKGKQLDFYEIGGERFTIEPAELWWQGLDKKTYDRIFAITLDDLQGVDIIQEVDVRTRFFGAEGGESLGTLVKDVDELASQLLVASPTGKRTINTLLERLQEIEQDISRLQQGEREYYRWQESLAALEEQEASLQEQRQERKEYIQEVERVLRAWDTYKRGEEAKQNMHRFHVDQPLEREAFLELDEEIRRCQEYMRIWRGKEDGLVPDNFDPEDALGMYEKEIEALYQEVSKWTQLEKECREGDLYLEKVQAQLAFIRKSHVYWRDVDTFPHDVNWYDGEQAARQLRSAREAYEAWQRREPFPQDESAREVTNAVKALEEKQAALEAMKEAYLSEQSTPAAETVTSGRSYYIGAVILVVLGVILLAWHMTYAETLGVPVMAGVLALLIGAGCAYKGYALGKAKVVKVSTKDFSNLETRAGRFMPTTESEYETLLSEIENISEQIKAYGDDINHFKAYEVMKAQWIAEGKSLELAGSEAMDVWEAWLPKEAKQTNRDDAFYGMKEEYQAYHERLREFEGYQKQVRLHHEQLEAIVNRCRTLWGSLQLTTLPSIVELRVVYNQLQLHKQNRVRWEQKESQRKNYREEYATWSKKEKELFLAQEELIQKAGAKSAVEYRQRLLQQDQYKQWDTIYRQSQRQLELLAPKELHRDVWYRRLQGNDKGKWELEYTRSEKELGKIEAFLQALYEERGTLQESMRHLSTSHAISEALLRKEQLEAELREALEEWMTYVFINHGMELAQQEYETDRQPAMLARASAYVKAMTGGIYTLHMDDTHKGAYVKDTTGREIPLGKWSSGLGDQVYLALRLSLAESFAEKVESMPLLLDDVLVRFDMERQKLTLQVIEQLSERTQVFLFTCHETTSQLASERVHRFDLTCSAI